jgi:hypothetical protein
MQGMGYATRMSRSHVDSLTASGSKPAGSAQLSSSAPERSAAFGGRRQYRRGDLNLADLCGSEVVVVCSRRTSFDRKSGETRHCPRPAGPFEFHNALRPMSLLPKRGIPSDSFSDSYGDFRGSVGIELLSDSVAC